VRRAHEWSLDVRMARGVTFAAMTLPFFPREIRRFLSETKRRRVLRV